MLDLVIRHATVIDGTGKVPYQADIGVAEDRIVCIAPTIEEVARQEMDASGMYVAPGFIDAHTHDDLVYVDDPYNMPKLAQGVTTVIAGNCGFGVVPATVDKHDEMAHYNRPILGKHVDDFSFDSFGAFASFLKEMKKAQNIASLLPHGTIYIAVKGFDAGKTTPEEKEKLASYIRSGLQEGALGVSLGLMYAPGCYCSVEDLDTAARIAGEEGGIVCIHMKSESEQFEICLRQAANMSKNCHVPVEISHLKHVGKLYVGKMDQTLELLDQLEREGADLSYDMYPYTMGSTTMSILFPTEYLHGGTEQLVTQLTQTDVRRSIAQRLEEMWGDEDNLSLLCGWENVLISSVESENNQSVLGLSMQDIAQERGCTPAEAMMDLYCEEHGNVSILLNHIQQSDMEKTLTRKGVTLISDGLPSAANPHPRLYGSFPRFLRMFVREKGLLTWEAAIHKMTLQPARRFGLKDRGAVMEGYFADLVVFDPQLIADTATFESPMQYPQGIRAVIVNGKTVLKDNVRQDCYPGSFISKERRT